MELTSTTRSFGQSGKFSQVDECTRSRETGGELAPVIPNCILVVRGWGSVAERSEGCNKGYNDTLNHSSYTKQEQGALVGGEVRGGKVGGRLSASFRLLLVLRCPRRGSGPPAEWFRTGRRGGGEGIRGAHWYYILPQCICFCTSKWSENFQITIMSIRIALPKYKASTDASEILTSVSAWK